MRRRDFIAGLAGATAWPIAAGAQQPDDLAKGWWLSELPVAEANAPAQ